MPNGDHLDGFFYPTLTLIIDSYNLRMRDDCQSHKKQDHGTQNMATNFRSRLWVRDAPPVKCLRVQFKEYSWLVEAGQSQGGPIYVV